MGNLSDQEYQEVVHNFNANEDISFLERRLDQLFESVVEQFPEKTALIHNEIEISYHELNVSANILARGLAKRGLKHGDVVGLSVSRSFDLVAVMLAVLKLGAAYVPIDPSFPAQRINHMLEDADPRFILLSDEPTEGYAFWKELCLSVSEVRDSSITDVSNLGTQIHHRDLAYILYTSGSTGRPKGVEVSHGASANFLTSLRKHEPGCNEHDRLLAITTISFDMSVLELFLPILSGATMIIANPSAVRDPREMVSLMKTHRVTILQATPATWTMLSESGWEGNPRLSKIICGGEPLLRQLADRLLASADSVWNVYGPAETTYGSVGRVGEGEIVVGRPVINGRIYLLDDNLSPVPLGCEGEVYIGGGSVSNGYRNKPELTISRFLSNPFHKGIFFRTGDLARFLDCEKLQVIGRIDGVVKIRGHRIDVGDVEAALLDHPNVSAAVVVSRDDRLVAYCVARIPTSLIGASLDSILRPWVSDRLPTYMVPSFFVPMDALPLSPNEKVNRNALPDPFEVLKRNPLSIQPTSELEQQIQVIWSAILNHEGFGIDDNFFNIGGDSVRIVRMQAALEKQLGRPVPTAKLFEHFTIKTLAAYLAGSKHIHSPKQKSRMVRPPDNTNEDIAIISMACRLPGAVATPEDFWQVLQSGGDTSTDVPKDRWDADTLYNPDPDVDGTSYCRRGGFLDSISSCDASFFGISPREARAMDPEQHLMLELGWEGFERAGYTRDRLSGSATGVFLGISNNGSSNAGPIDLKGHSITGSAGATLSGRLSYSLNLQGPSLTVDTACSSSLVATHLACNALRQGECDTALVGGVSLLLTPGIHIEFSKLRGLSADGRCKAFSNDTDGTGFSEGAATVILKRLSDAKRDGDTIHAVLRGTAVMHGGNSVSLTAPNGPGQENLIRIALAQSALEPESIDYIEAHGTATKLGDPIEATALAGVFGEGRPRSGPLRLGSVKSNVGHTQAAAGLIGLLKVVLSMQNNMLPKTLHVNEPTRAIDWKSSNLELVLENQPWLPINNRIRRAGVSAFGIGGTNAHAIVEEFRGSTTEKTTDTTQTALPASMLFVLSANSESALRAQAAKIQSYMEIGSGIDHRLHDVAYSLATSRTHFHRRMAVSAMNKQHMLKQLESISSGASELPSSNEAGKASLGMLFTGQGSQRLGMGKELYTVFPIFRDALDEIAAQFTDLEYPLLDVMWAKPGSLFASLLNRTDFAQPALFALQVSLWTLWQSWGVKATLLLGHSVGELAIAHVSGILNLQDACRLVLMRGRLMQAITRQGKMTAIESNSTDVAAVLKQLNLSKEVQIASHNTPSQTVVSGDVAAVGAVEAHFASLGVKRRVLETSHAFHSYHMDEMLDDFKAIAKTAQFFPPTIPIISSRTGKLASVRELQRAEYWTEQIRNAVQFCDAFQSLSDAGANVFLEIGPSPTLCGLGAACLSDTPQARNAVWLPSMKPNADGCSVIQDSMGKLHVRDVPVDWSAFYEPFGCQRVELPTYAFQRKVTQSAKQRWFDTSVPNTGPEKIAQDVRNMMFEINWRPIESRVAPPHGSLGILYTSEETTWTKDVQNALSTAGIKLVPVTKHQEAEGLDGLLSLWDPNADVVQTAHDFTEKALSQLQEAIQTGYAAPVVWVTRHAISTGHGDRPLRIGGAPLLGLMRTARSEHPELCLRLIDMDDETPLASLCSALMLGGPTEIVIRNKQLLEPHMERMSSTVASPSLPRQVLLRAGGTVLVTGGLGDLGSRVARRLVTSHGVRDLVLLSRRGMQTPGAEAIVASLAKLGAKATVVAVDLAVLEDLRSVMQLFSSERPLSGVVHAAGVVDSGTLPSLTPQKCASTFTPKVDGLWNLHQLTKGMDLDFFVMFSSISGIMGLPGLGNYAAANSFVDMLAFMRRAQGLPATSLAYGTWNGDGMVTTLISSTRAHLSQLGLGLISPDIGLDLFEQAIREGHTLSVPALLDVEKLKVYYENQGGVPPFLRSMLGQMEVTKPVPLTANLRGMLIEATLESRGGIVLRTVQATVAKALEYARPEDLDANRPLEDFGIDSLTAVLMRNRLATVTGVGLPPNITLLYPNLNSLSDYLLAKLAKEIDEPITTVPVVSHIDMAAIRRGVLDPKFQFRNVIKHTTGWSEPPKNVLVTGPTGFVGAFMVDEFLRRGMDVYCLVRASNVRQAQERMIETLQRYNLWKSDYEPLLHVVVGDLSQPLFGLCEVEFDDLANAVDSILHSGALVDWMRPLEEYVGPNILGTHEILRLASRGRGKAVHFISTISTLPIHLGYGLTENDREYGYGTSKYMAERMVAAARFRGALTSSYRLPFVAASATNGQFRLDRGDFLNNLITGSLDLGVFPSIAADMSSVLPVDYLCNTIATIMIGDHQRIGEDYDFVNPQSPTFDEFFQLMGAASGGKAIIPFSKWHVQALEYAAVHPKSCVARITAILDGYTDETASEMVKGGPLSKHVLGLDIYPAPLIDEKYVQRYLKCLMAAKAEI